MNKRRRNRLKEPGAGISPGKVGWRINEFADAVGLCRASVYNLLAAGSIDSVKIGAARIIVTAPRDYLTALAKEAA